MKCQHKPPSLLTSVSAPGLLGGIPDAPHALLPSPPGRTPCGHAERPPRRRLCTVTALSMARVRERRELKVCLGSKPCSPTCSPQDHS